jgi:hypothetical protein
VRKQLLNPAHIAYLQLKIGDSISNGVAIVGLNVSVPFATQVCHGREIGPVFPHTARLPQQTQAILSLELLDPSLHGVVDDLVWRVCPGVAPRSQGLFVPVLSDAILLWP